MQRRAGFCSKMGQSETELLSERTQWLALLAFAA
jgi:hypothetical protein